MTGGTLTPPNDAIDRSAAAESTRPPALQQRWVSMQTLRNKGGGDHKAPSRRGSPEAPAVPHVAAGRAGQQLGDVLVLRGLVTHAQVQEALELQATSGGRLGELLVQMGVLEERDLVEALAEFFGMPVADLRRYKPDPDALALIPENVARENMAMPISLHDDGLHVAVAEPSDSLRFLLSEKSWPSGSTACSPR